MDIKVHKEVQDYYGKELQSTADLKTNACCTDQEYPTHIKEALAQIHDEVLAKYYGCGLTIPTTLKGMKILDLGSGSGRDCYLLSKLVGEEGEVVGIDMTDEQLEVANKHLDFHKDAFGYKKGNVRFIKGNIEKLNDLGLEENYFDIIISNCVINLATDKLAVLKGAYNLLKSGGELYFSDVYSDRRVPEYLVKDPVLYGECLSGALYTNDFIRFAHKSGFTDPRMMDTRRLTINHDEVQRKVENIKFYSTTYRLFKLEKLETLCEEYGQAVTYKGGIEEMPFAFRLDDHHVFEKGKIESVCGNTYMMLANTRFRDFFDFYGDFDTHYGLYGACYNNDLDEGAGSSEGCC